MANEEMMTVDDLCESLKSSRHHVYKLRDTGQIRFYDISMGNKQERALMRCKKSDVEAFLEIRTMDSYVEEVAQ